LDIKEEIAFVVLLHLLFRCVCDLGQASEKRVRRGERRKEGRRKEERRKERGGEELCCVQTNKEIHTWDMAIGIRRNVEVIN
jgi:hypothetical protein